MNTYYCVCVFNTGSTVYIDFDFTGDKKEHARTEKIQIHTHTHSYLSDLAMFGLSPYQKLLLLLYVLEMSVLD